MNREYCTTCSGTGVIKGIGLCRSCNGESIIRDKFSMFYNKKCPTCHGTGDRLILKTCPSCQGSGEKREVNHDVVFG